jgi:hypothetical protein
VPQVQTSKPREMQETLLSCSQRVVCQLLGIISCRLQHWTRVSWMQEQQRTSWWCHGHSLSIGSVQAQTKGWRWWWIQASPKGTHWRGRNGGAGVWQCQSLPKLFGWSGNTVSTRKSIVTNSSVDKSDYIDRNFDFEEFEWGNYWQLTRTTINQLCMRSWWWRWWWRFTVLYCTVL